MLRPIYSKSRRAELRERVTPSLNAGGRYEAAMVANAMAIAIRELELGGKIRAEEQASLGKFYGMPSAALPELRRRLCQDLRDGTVLTNRPDELRTLLSKVVHARLAISNPDYARTHG